MVKQKKRNGEGSFRMQCGRWNYRFTYKDEFGESRRKSITADSRVECLESAERFLENLERNRFGYGPDASVSEIMKKNLKMILEKTMCRKPHSVQT